jgi:hypothetical protein
MVMAKTWVLDTETKGTGARVVPLEKVLSTGERKPELNLVDLERPAAPKPAPEPEPAPAPPRRFKVVDVMTRETLAEDADTRTTVELLGQVRSIVDVHVYAWNPQRRRWQLLGLDEQRTLWGLRTPPPGASRAA